MKTGQPTESRRGWRYASLTSLILGMAGLLWLALVAAGSDPVRADLGNSPEKLKVFAEALAIIEDHYVEPKDTKNLVYGSIRGVVGSLDSHSSFMTPEEFRELRIETRGSFSGIGIEITLKDGLLMVVSPIEGSPAYRAGLQAGDRIMKIDGAITKNMTLLDAVKRIRGPKGSPVTLTIMREGAKQMKSYTLTRDIIPIKSVKARYLEDGIGYIRVTNFQDQTDGDLRKAIREFQTKIKPFRGLVLDLRNDPGGLLDQAVRVADEFLAGGIIVYTEGRNKAQTMKFYAHASDKALESEIPLVVLINEGSASASEIVAGAIQDQKRGLVVGTKSFGKGSVQTIIPLEDGSALRLTTAFYYTPSGKTIHEKGIIPDLVVEASPLADDKSLKEMRDEALEKRMRRQGLTDKPWSQPVTAEELKADPQLAKALEVIKKMPPRPGSGMARQ